MTKPLTDAELQTLIEATRVPGGKVHAAALELKKLRRNTVKLAHAAEHTVAYFKTCTYPESHNDARELLEQAIKLYGEPLA